LSEWGAEGVDVVGAPFESLDFLYVGRGDF
jgi:hypothetical protein